MTTRLLKIYSTVLRPESLPVLREEVAAVVRNLKAGKSPGVDKISSELLQDRGDSPTTVLAAIRQKIWETTELPKEWTQSLVIPLPKKGNLRQRQNYRTISSISHPSKIMLRFILNRLKAKAEELLTEEPAGFRPSRSTVEQIMRQNNKMRGDRVTLPALLSLRPSHFTGQPISSVIYKETGW